MTKDVPDSLLVLFANSIPSDDAVFNEHRQKLAAWAREERDRGGLDVELVIPDRNEAELVPARLGEADVLVVQEGNIDRALLARAPRLRLIHVIGTQGADVDLSSATDAGVPVAVVPHYGCVVVAEHAISLMLALLRKLVPLHEATRRGDNPRNLPTIATSQYQRHFNWLGLPDDELGSLYGRTLGIIGLGEIGTEVARRATAFGMRVLYVKRTRLEPAEEARLSIEHADLDDLLAQSDIVSIHSSHNEQTDKLINAATLGKMKPSALLINTARGGIVDTEALIAALESGTIAGAGIDVFATEPHSADSPLSRLENVVLSPHVAARAPVLGRYADLIENLGRLRAGSPPKGLKNPDVFSAA